MKDKPIVIYTSLILAMIFWSLSFVWYKIAYISFGPISVVLIRLIIACIILFLLATSTNRFQKIQIQDVKHFILLAFFEPFIYFIGESYGIKFISSTLAAVMVSTIPLFTLIFTYYIHNEKLTVVNIIGIFISITGVIFVVFDKGINSTISVKGILLMLVAVIGAVGYSVYVKKLADKYNPFMVVGYQNLFGIAFFLPVFFLIEFKSLNLNQINREALIAILELAIFASSFAFVFFIFSLRRIGVSKATALVNAIPALTAIFAFYIIGEPINIIKTLGIGIVITGLLLSQLKRRRKQEIFLDDGQNLSG